MVSNYSVSEFRLNIDVNSITLAEEIFSYLVLLAKRNSFTDLKCFPQAYPFIVNPASGEIL